jgi:hypothetical protein
VLLLRTIALLALGLLGCAATAELHAKPDAVCAGRAVRLTWDGSSSGELSAEPADPSLGEVPASGQKTVHPKVTTTYRLRVSSGFASQTSETKVQVVTPPPGGAQIAGAISDEGGGCAPGKVWVTARVEPGSFDPRLRIDQVRSMDGRDYFVQHAAQTAEVKADTPSDGLRDLPPAGAWRIETPLRAGETCGGASSPELISIALSFVCAD